MRMTVDFASLVAPLVPLVLPFLGMILAVVATIATTMFFGRR